MPTEKSDADFCFIPAYYGYWRSYLVGRIKNGCWCPWSVRTGIHIFWEWHRWRIHLGWQTWMLSRFADGTSWGNLYESEEVYWWKTWLGACPCSVFNWYAVGVVDKQPSLLRPSWRPKQDGGGDKGTTGKGSWVVAVIGRNIDKPFVILCSPACLYVCNDEDTLWACTKNPHQGWR